MEEDIKNLKEDIKDLKSCNWLGHNQILIKPRDFFQITGDGESVHTNYNNKGGAVELYDDWDVLAQYIIPKNCKATKVVISMNEDCNRFKVYTSKLLNGLGVLEQNIDPNTKLLATKSFPSGLKDGQFTSLSANIGSFDTSSNVLSIVVEDDAGDSFSGVGNSGDNCDVSGGYIKLEPK